MPCFFLSPEMRPTFGHWIYRKFWKHKVIKCKIKILHTKCTRFSIWQALLQALAKESQKRFFSDFYVISKRNDIFGYFSSNNLFEWGTSSKFCKRKYDRKVITDDRGFKWDISYSYSFSFSFIHIHIPGQLFSTLIPILVWKW